MVVTIAKMRMEKNRRLREKALQNNSSESKK